MKSLCLTAFSEEEMEKIGKEFISFCKAPAIVYLKGDLGAGKTTLVRGFLRGLGYSDAVKSPTYTLVESYDVNHQKIFHFDLYRLHDPEELELMGIRDYFHEDAICFIEWPQHGYPFLPPPTIVCEIVILDKGRELKISNCL